MHPDGCIGQPAEPLQCSDLTKNHPGDRPDEAEDSETDGVFGDLRKSLTIRDNNDTDVEEQLYRLGVVYSMTGDRPIYTKGNVAIALERDSDPESRLKNIRERRKPPLKRL